MSIDVSPVKYSDSDYIYTPFMYFHVKFNIALNWFLHENKSQHHLPAACFRYKVTLQWARFIFRNTLLFCDLRLEKKYLDQSDNSS